MTYCEIVDAAGRTWEARGVVRREYAPVDGVMGMRVWWSVEDMRVRLSTKILWRPQEESGLNPVRVEEALIAAHAAHAAAGKVDA